jgi:hypothetical protein
VLTAGFSGSCALKFEFTELQSTFETVQVPALDTSDFAAIRVAAYIITLFVLDVYFPEV